VPTALILAAVAWGAPRQGMLKPASA
jgi:hypothetical protein